MMLVAGFLILAGLCVPTTLLMDNAGSTLSLGERVLKIAIFLWPSIALIMAAFAKFWFELARCGGKIELPLKALDR